MRRAQTMWRDQPRRSMRLRAERPARTRPAPPTSSPAPVSGTTGTDGGSTPKLCLAGLALSVGVGDGVAVGVGVGVAPLSTAVDWVAFPLGVAVTPPEKLPGVLCVLRSCALDPPA